MDKVQLEASLRTAIGSNAVNKLRNQGIVPGVVYGKDVPGGKLEVQVPLTALTRLLAVHPGNTLLELQVVGHGNLPVVIKEVQREAVLRTPMHVDFKQVNLTEKLVAEVAVHLVGTPQGVKAGGVLEQVARTVEVKCLPSDLPEVIEISVTELGLGEKLTAKSIALPANVELAGDPEQVIATVAEVVEKEEGEETVVAEPEVIREKKETKE
ncbi:MAG: 50S ribosomal protein L25 [Bacillota bacterium]